MGNSNIKSYFATFCTPPNDSLSFISNSVQITARNCLTLIEKQTLWGKGVLTSHRVQGWAHNLALVSSSWSLSQSSWSSQSSSQLSSSWWDKIQVWADCLAIVFFIIKDKDKDKYKKIQRHGEELLKHNTMQGQARGLARGSHHLIIFRLPVEKQILSVFCRFLSKDLQIAHQTLKMHQNKQKWRSSWKQFQRMVLFVVISFKTPAIHIEYFYSTGQIFRIMIHNPQVIDKH